MDAIVGGIFGILGAVIGFALSEWSTRRRAAQSSKDEQSDFRLFAKVAEINKGEGMPFMPEIASEEHMRAERLVAKGILDRWKLPVPAYSVPGTYYTAEDKMRLSEEVYGKRAGRKDEHKAQ